MKREIRIGISGWTYPPWRKRFYPDGLPQKRELEYASRQVNSIEINGTFYSLQTPKSFAKWHDATPEDFVFSVKGNRYITHFDRLENPKAPLANFMASGLLNLGKKLGPFLWQFPPSFSYDRNLLENFFKLLPRDHEQVARLAHEHDATVSGRAVLTPQHDGKVRHAIEIRHRSFENEEFIGLLREHRIGMVVADTAGKWPVIEDATADLVYIRLHGDQKLYVSGYTEEALEDWARKIHRWAEGGTPQDARKLTPAPPVLESGRNVYVYFDNDVKTHAPFDAISLGRRFGLAPVPLEDFPAASRTGDEGDEEPRSHWPARGRRKGTPVQETD